MELHFSKLQVWNKAHLFVLEIYKISKNFPSEERYRLVDQLCRSASSIATNIVEGNTRSSKKDFARFIEISQGSLEETKYHLLLARDLGYLEPVDFESLIMRANEIGRMLSGLSKSAKS